MRGSRISRELFFQRLLENRKRLVLGEGRSVLASRHKREVYLYMTDKGSTGGFPRAPDLARAGDGKHANEPESS